MQSRQDKQFYELISRVVETEDFIKMRQYRHHVHGCTYDHSIKVAYLCYRHYQRFGSKVELGELIRGALLHDYFLYDHHDKNMIPPKTRYGWLVCFYDKVAAVKECYGKRT